MSFLLKRISSIGISGLIITALSACVSLPDAKKQSLDEVLASSEVIRFQYRRSETGLILADLAPADDTVMRFMVDTGATRSAIYDGAIPSRDLLEGSTLVRVHGISNSELRPTVFVKQGATGAEFIEGTELAVLDKPAGQGPLSGDVRGIFGLDLLSGFRVLFDAESKKIVLIGADAPAIAFDKSWRAVSLTQQPDGMEALGLYFIELKFKNTSIAAVLDSGADFNAMNWEFKTLPELNAKRRSLRNRWKVDGAIDEFKPRTLASIDALISRDYAWGPQSFIVYDLTMLDAAGWDGKPIMIAGAPFIDGKTVLIDFPGKTLWIKTAP